MRSIKSVYINDVCQAIPYFDFKMKKRIISELEAKRRNGYIIRGIEVDDVHQCIIYSEPNKVFN